MLAQGKRFSKESRREQIVSAACKLFAVKGYDLTTMKEIAAAVEVGEALIFHYFPSKDAIFQELLDKLGEMLKQERPLEIIGGSAIETLRLFVESTWNSPVYLTGAEDERTLVLAATRNRQNYERELREVVRRAPDIVTMKILPVVVFGQQTGEIRSGDPVELASAFFACVGGADTMRRNYSEAFHVPSVDLCLDIVRKTRLGD